MFVVMFRTLILFTIVIIAMRIMGKRLRVACCFG